MPTQPPDVLRRLAEKERLFGGPSAPGLLARHNKFSCADMAACDEDDSADLHEVAAVLERALEIQGTTRQQRATVGVAQAGGSRFEMEGRAGACGCGGTGVACSVHGHGMGGSVHGDGIVGSVHEWHGLAVVHNWHGMAGCMAWHDCDAHGTAWHGCSVHGMGSVPKWIGTCHDLQCHILNVKCIARQMACIGRSIRSFLMPLWPRSGRLHGTSCPTCQPCLHYPCRRRSRRSAAWSAHAVPA